MNVLVIPDKFKDALTAKQVIAGIKQGIYLFNPNAAIYSFIMSDGGDGFLDAICNIKPGLDKVYVDAVNPLGEKISSFYLFDDATKTAYIELANASGLQLLVPENRNALKTSTIGTGHQILHAAGLGAKSIYIGLGGSATNDGGTGIAHVLGYGFLNAEGIQVHPSGENLIHFDSIKDERTEIIKEAKFYAVNDVNNVLFGPNGAAYVYGRQKGATGLDLELLDKGLQHLQDLVIKYLGQNEAFEPGAGAAGGAAYGLKVFLGAEFISGVDFIFELASVERLISERKIDLIITGEGKIDKQTLNGKLIKGVSRLAKNNNIPIVAVCGKCELTKKDISNMGFKDVLEISDASLSLEENLKNAYSLLVKSIGNYFFTHNS